MNSPSESPALTSCAGPLNRRGFMHIGLSLNWPGLLRLRAENAAKTSPDRTAVIPVWLRGRCLHLDTYDPKPDIGSEYRALFQPIATKVPGMQLTELLPLQAKIADKFTLHLT